MKKFHIVYKTTNNINNKIYIGFHSTNKIHDSYLGSGNSIKAAIRKYGKESFTKEILKVFTSREEARSYERLLVDEDFIKRNDTYNLTLGGTGIDSQLGEKNHMWGKLAHNRKPLIAYHNDGRILKADSIRHLSDLILMNRSIIRRLINKQKVGRRGWKILLDKDIV